MEETKFKTTEAHRACSARYYQENKDRLNARRAERYRELHPPKPKKPKKVKRIPVERLPQDVLETVDGRFYRRRFDTPALVNPVSKSKKCEFIWIVEGITKHKFDDKEWRGHLSGASAKRCICGEEIGLYYFITHMPTDISFLVGSKCVKKVSQHLYDMITHESCIAPNCWNPVMDMRTKHGKCGYCSNTCQENSTLSFGKYKGADIRTIPDSYWKWMERTIEAHDPEEEDFLQELLTAALAKKEKIQAV